MELKDAIQLLQNDHIVKNGISTWADLGCGNGLFTQALTHFLQKESRIYAIDLNEKALSEIGLRYNDVNIERMQDNFLKVDLQLQPLDGILMANSFHFVADKISFLKKARRWLQPEGKFLFIEYDTDSANPWVPYPVSFHSLCHLSLQLKFSNIEKLHQHPSIYNRAPIYSALIKT